MVQQVKRCCFSADGSRIVSLTEAQNIARWNILDGQHDVQTVNFARILAKSQCNFSPDGSLLLLGSFNIEVHSSDDGKPLKTFRLQKFNVNRKHRIFLIKKRPLVAVYRTIIP